MSNDNIYKSVWLGEISHQLLCFNALHHINHEGNLDLAIHMSDLAFKAGAEIIKNVFFTSQF